MTKRDFTKREIYVEYSFGPTATEKKQFSLFVDPNIDLRTAAKQPIAEYTGIPIDEIHIYFSGKPKEFDDSKSLRYYGLQGGGFFNMSRHEEDDISTDTTRGDNNKKNGGHLKIVRRPSYSDVAKRAVGNQPPAAIMDMVDSTRRRSSLLFGQKLREQQAADAAKAIEEEKLRQEEEARRKKEQEENDRRAKQQAEEDAAKLKREAEERAAQEENQRQEEAARRRKEQEERARREKQQAEGDAARRKKEAEERAPISITIHNRATGKKQKLVITPVDKLDDIKQQIEKEAGVPMNMQQLFLGSKELKNPSQSAKEYGIKDGSIIDLEPKPISISVQTPNGKVIHLQVQLSDTTSDTKSRIERETGIKSPIVTFQGQELPAGKSLDAMGVQDGSTLILEMPKITITVNDRKNGKTIKLMVDPTESITQIQQKLEKESGIPMDKQKLTMAGQEFWNPKRSAADCGIKGGSVLDLEVKPINITVITPVGKIIKLSVNPSDKPSDIRAKVEKETGMKVAQQILKFKGKELANEKSPESSGVRDGSELVVEAQKIPVTVNTSSGKRIQIMVDPTDTVSEIKKQLEKESGIPVGKQKLSMNGKELSSPNQSADKCGIKPGAVLDLEPKPINITVRTPSGKIHKIQTKPDAKISDIKARVEKETGLKAPQQLLKFLGQEIPNGRTLESAGVKDGSELTVDIHKVPVTVHSSNGKKIQIMVDPTDSISQIKQQLENESGIPHNKQKLSMNGKELSNANQSAGDYGIKAGSVLQLEPKAISITVRAPGGKVIKLQVQPGDKAADIKAKVEKETGLKAPEQLVKFKGKEISSTGSIETMGVQDGSELTVEVRKPLNGTAARPTARHPPAKKPVSSPSSAKTPPRPKTPPAEDKIPVTTSDVFVALTIPGVNSNLSAKDCSVLAEKSQEFYALQLRNKYGSAFEDVVVSTKNSRHGSDQPNKNYNIYIEWDIKARFDENMGEAIPDRNTLIRSLVQVNLSDYLIKYVRSLSGTPFAGATGMFTEQVNRNL